MTTRPLLQPACAAAARHPAAPLLALLAGSLAGPLACAQGAGNNNPAVAPAAPATATAPATPANAPAAAIGPTGEWTFQVTLDGKPIGEHRFVVTGQGDERSVKSTASFDVKFFGLTAYRYRHEAQERWRGGCLVSLQSTTDDDGKRSEVKAQRESDGADAELAVQRTGGSQKLPGCVSSFAYWNPSLQKQSQLLDPQSGRYQAVQFRAGKTGTVEVRGKPVEARQVLLTGPKDPIELWYSPQGEWLALDSVVSGRRLSYRLP